MPKPHHKANGVALDSFEPIAITLVMDHRLCNCGFEYIVPNNKLMVRHASGYTTATQAIARQLREPHYAGIDRETRHVHTKLEACPRCFVACDGAPALFPKPPAPTRAPTRQELGDLSWGGEEPAPVRKAKREPYVPKLSDF
jgi:hypothetical protein